MDPGGAPDSRQPRTLYVGNLDPQVSEDLIVATFNAIGPVKGCKLIREPSGGDPYCFVEFHSHAAAVTALTAMNKRVLMDREIRVNWATNNPGGPAANGHHFNNNGGGAALIKPDTSQHHHIFVGDLTPEVETETLRAAFQPFGEISDCRVIKDQLNNKSKGYGFVSFVHKADAQRAIENMNGQWLGSRAIRTNWATRKPPFVTAAKTADGTLLHSGGGGGGGAGTNGHGPRHAGGQQQPLNFDDVFALASPTNCTVYCGGLLGADDNVIRRAFSPFGRVVDVRHFRDKGYAFIKFDVKESACNAIVALNGTSIVAGHSVRCSWGKENGGQPNHHSQHHSQQHFHNQHHLQQHSQQQQHPMENGLSAQQQAYILQQQQSFLPPHLQQQQQQAFLAQQQHQQQLYAMYQQNPYGYQAAFAAGFPNGAGPQQGGGPVAPAGFDQQQQQHPQQQAAAAAAAYGQPQAQQQ